MELWGLVGKSQVEGTAQFILFGLGVLLCTKDGAQGLGHAQLRVLPLSHILNPSISCLQKASSFCWCCEGYTKPRGQETTVLTRQAAESGQGKER